MRTTKKKKLEPFTIVSIIGVGFFMVLCVVPFWMIISGSFTAESKLATTGYSLIPQPFSTAAYETIFTGPTVLEAYFASIFIMTD